MVLHYNYLLGNTVNNKTYNGYTIDPLRRLRQHNGELSGGARFTSVHPGTWYVVLTISCPEMTKREALSLEWSVRYPTNKRPRPKEYSGVHGRLHSLPLVFNNPKFSKFTFDVVVYAEEYADKVQRVLSNVSNVCVKVKDAGM